MGTDGAASRRQALPGKGASPAPEVGGRKASAGSGASAPRHTRALEKRVTGGGTHPGCYREQWTGQADPWDTFTWTCSLGSSARKDRQPTPLSQAIRGASTHAASRQRDREERLC